MTLTQQLLQIAAPLLMGALGQQQIAQQSNPDMMSILNNLLDRDRDGSALDDILGMVGKLFGRQKS